MLDQSSSKVSNCLSRCFNRNDGCTIRIGVHAYSSAGFTLTASSSVKAIELQGNIPLIGYVERGGYKYYKIMKRTLNTSSLNFVLTPLTGDPDLYVSNSTPTPDIHTYDYKSNSFNLAMESVEIYNHSQGWWYIGVHAFGALNSTYNLLAHDSSDKTSIKLQGGMPQGGLARKDEFIYYIIPPGMSVYCFVLFIVLFCLLFIYICIYILI